MAARRGEFEAMQRETLASLPRFLERLTDSLRGRRVFLIGTWTSLFAMARGGLDRGLHNVFAADSAIVAGGGAKGQAVPADWEDRWFPGLGHDLMLEARTGRVVDAPVAWLSSHVMADDGSGNGN
jgi:hypothetical protein